MNRINDWQELLRLANEDLSPRGIAIKVEDDEGRYSVDIDGIPFAENYYEDDLSECVNDAWAHARLIAHDREMKRILREQEDWGRAFPVVTIDRDELRNYGFDCNQPDAVMEEIARNMGEMFDDSYADALIKCATNAGVKNLNDD